MIVDVRLQEFPSEARKFIKHNYLDVGNVLVAGQYLGKVDGPKAIPVYVSVGVTTVL